MFCTAIITGTELLRISVVIHPICTFTIITCQFFFFFLRKFKKQRVFCYLQGNQNVVQAEQLDKEKQNKQNPTCYG